MDPNACYERILAELKRFRADGEEGDLSALLDAVEDLDEWLRKGGVLPAAWGVGAAPG